MNQESLYALIVGLIIGGIIYWVATLVPEPTLAKIIQFVGIFIIFIVVINFVFALLGFPPLLKIG